MSGNIVIHTLRCGAMRVLPRERYIADRGLLRERIELPVNAYLIEHPKHGRILLDTGWSSDCRELLPPRLLKFYEPKIGKGETAAEQLEDMGLRPEDIDLVLMSHLDVDHTCALKDFAGRAGRIACSELEYFYSCRMVYKMRQVWDTWMPYADDIERIHYHASVLGPVGRGFDLFGDESILCIYTPGHTDGIFTTLVTREPTNRFKAVGTGIYWGDYAVLASDVAFCEDNLRDSVIPGYGFDRGLQAKSLEFLQTLRRDPKCRAMLFSHDPASPASVEL